MNVVPQVRCAVVLAIYHFHSGARRRERVMESLMIPVGGSTKKSFILKDKNCVRQSDGKMSENTKGVAKLSNCVKPNVRKHSVKKKESLMKQEASETV